jgi:hypothetical protein
VTTSNSNVVLGAIALRREVLFLKSKVGDDYLWISCTRELPNNKIRVTVSLGDQEPYEDIDYDAGMFVRVNNVLKKYGVDTVCMKDVRGFSSL